MTDRQLAAHEAHSPYSESLGMEVVRVTLDEVLLRMPVTRALTNRNGVLHGGALIGLAGAIGALGGFGVNLAFRQSFLSLGNANGAYLAFIGCYAICMAVTWFWFIRPRPARLQGV